MDRDTFMWQGDEDADKDVDVIFIMLHIFLTHSLLFISNRHQQMLLLDALSTVTDTGNSNMSNNQTYMVKHIQKPNRGENHSQWLYDDVVNCKAVNIEDINCCETANNKINIARLALTKSHHFDLLHFQNSQVENITEQLLEKKNTVYVFDAECIQEVDNFKVYIDIYITQTQCLKTLQQDLLPISLLIPKYIQSIPNYKALMALFDSCGSHILCC